MIVDTCAYSEFMRNRKPIVDAIARALVIVVPPIVLGELEAGFRHGSHAERNRATLQAFLSSPRVRIPPISSATATRYGAILDYLRGNGTPIPTNDVWIAAVAMEGGWPVLTTDRHFLKMPQVLVEFYDTADNTSP